MSTNIFAVRSQWETVYPFMQKHSRFKNMSWSSLWRKKTFQSAIFLSYFHPAEAQSSSVARALTWRMDDPVVILFYPIQIRYFSAKLQDSRYVLSARWLTSLLLKQLSFLYISIWWVTKDNQVIWTTDSDGRIILNPHQCYNEWAAELVTFEVFSLHKSFMYLKMTFNFKSNITTVEAENTPL